MCGIECRPTTHFLTIEINIFLQKKLDFVALHHCILKTFEGRERRILAFYVFFVSKVIGSGSRTLVIIYCFQDSDDEDVEQEIDAQIEQLLSAKRTVRNIDAASAANVIGEYFEQCTDNTGSMPRRAALVSQAHCQNH